MLSTFCRYFLKEIDVNNNVEHNKYMDTFSTNLQNILIQVFNDLI